MAAPTGWKIEKDGEKGWAATLWAGATDITTVRGLESRFECFLLIAVYYVLLVYSKESQATRMLRDLIGRVEGKPS